MGIIHCKASTSKVIGSCEDTHGKLKQDIDENVNR